MADFCKQCSLAVFNQDFGDFASIVTEEEFTNKFLVGIVLCENCGPIEVNHLGECVSEKCGGHYLE